MIYAIIVLTGVAIVAIGLIVRKRRPGEQLPPGLAAGVVGLVLGISLTLLTLHLFEWINPPPRYVVVDSALMQPTTPSTSELPPPLEPGADLPPLSAEGWLNGEPPRLGSVQEPSGHRALVLDVWANWCPVCRETAPNLVEVERKYRDRGVTFVSIASDPRSVVETYVAHSAATWPHAYGVPLTTIESLGTREAAPTPGYDVRPTLYLISPQGKVIWCDQHMRYMHESPAATQAALEKALESVLQPDAAKHGDAVPGAAESAAVEPATGEQQRH
jgi:thiol-disulfide isomerase/thioredoxin